MDREVLGQTRGEPEPAVAAQLREQLAQEIEQALERARAGQRAHLRGDHGFEQRGVEVLRDPIADVDHAAAELHEEAVARRRRDDGLFERAHELARGALHDVGDRARALGPRSDSSDRRRRRAR